MIGSMNRNLIVASFLFAACPSWAQLAVNSQTDLQQLAEAISGPGVRITNPTIDCHAQGFGEFTYTGTSLDVNEGVLLTTGTIANAVGPNLVSNRTFEQNRPGNAILNTVTGRTTFDACRFEFDIIPGGDTLEFNFAFSSEEYNEWVGSQYNDVFGFFISGPGIVGDAGIGNDKNIALIPGTTQAVTINTVNNASNEAYHTDNTGGSHIQYDGITNGLSAVSAVQPCQTYRLKLIVADASDRKFDSGVFIERIQSNAIGMTATTANGISEMVEGCNSGLLTFTRQNITASPVVVPYFLAGTTTNGADYPLIGDADQLIAKLVTIPGGSASASVTIDPIADGINEPLELLRVYLGNSVCPGSYIDSLELPLRDTLLASVNSSTSICSGSSTTLNASGGLSYTWTPSLDLSDPNSASPTAEPGTTTTYTVQVMAGTCEANLSTTVSVSNMLLNATVTRPLCQGNTNAAINLSVTGGTAPYSYSWSGPGGYTSSAEDLVGIAAGTYTVTVTDGAACSAVQSFNVSAPSALSITTSPSILAFGENIACSGGNTGSIGLAINGGTAPYAVSWSGPNGFTANTANINGLVAGSYTVIVTDANGCSVNGERTMTSPDALQPTITDVGGNTCFGGSTGMATVTISGGVQPHSFTWNSVPTQSEATATGLTSGNYTVSITDGYGCTTTAPVVISGPAAALSGSISTVALPCAGVPSGSAMVAISGGTAPYTTTWNTVPTQTGPTAIGLSSGPIAVTIADANGCSTTVTSSITSPSQPLSAGIAQTIDVTCAGAGNGSSTAIASGGTSPYSYSWNSLPSQSGPQLQNVNGGTYTVTVTDANGCSTTASTVINEPSQVTTVQVIDMVGVSCFGGQNGSATANASGGSAPYTYSWNSVPAQNSDALSNVSAGTYTVTVTDGNGCIATTTATIGGPSQGLIVAITSFTNVTCFEDSTGTAIAVAQGGTAPYVYSWNSVPFQSGATAEDLPEGVFTVTASDQNGCTAQTTVSIDAPDLELLAMIESYSHVSCFGANDGTATITISGGSGSYSVVWDTQPAQTGLTATGLSPGNYTALAIDNNGCDTQKQVNVTILGPSAPLQLDLALSNYNGFQVSCPTAEDGSIDLTIQGGTAPYTIVWSDTQGNTVGSEDISNLSTDLYTIAVTDAFGCLVDSTVLFTAPPAITAQAAITTASCQGATTGAIDITASGGVGPLQASWTGPNGYSANTLDITSLQAGIYTLTLTDANGCTSVNSFNVNEPGLFQVSTTLSQYTGGWNVSCATATDGAIDLTVTGGSQPYTYQWNGPNGFTANTEDIQNIGVGEYELIITDDNGCTTRENQTIEGPLPLTITWSTSLFGNTATSCITSADGSINATISGGTPGYQSSWTGPNGYTSGLEDISGLTAGTYTIGVMDENGCTASEVITLTAPPSIDIIVATSTSVSGEEIACTGGNSGSIALDLSGGTAPFSVIWSGPNSFFSNSTDISGLTAGTYQASITDGNGCPASTQVTLSEPTPLAISSTLSDQNGTGVSCATAMDGSIDLDITGGAAPYSVIWTGPNGFISTAEDLSGIGAGSYAALITDVNGCAVSSTLPITAPPSLTAQLSLTQAIGCSGSSQGAIDLSITGGLSPYDVAWTGPNGFSSTDEDLSALFAGNYQVAITDANGCITEGSIGLTEAPELTLGLIASTFVGGSNIPCSGGDGGAVELTITGGTAPFTILWTDGLGFTSTDEDLTNIGAGAYQVNVTDANGCMADQLVTLTAPQTLAAASVVSDFNGSSISCTGASDGSIDLTITGGTAPYAVQWNTGTMGEDLGGLSEGTYTASITDANGCALQLSFVLSPPQGIAIDITAQSDLNGFEVSCADGANGTLQASVGGGSGGVSIAWTGPNGFSSTDTDLSGLAPGNYALIATDQNGCTANSSITLNAPAPIGILANSLEYNGGTNISCQGASDGSIAVAIGGGVPEFDITWSGPNGYSADSTTINDLVAGTYVITVTDGNGCSTDASVILNEPDVLTATTILSDAGAGHQVGCSGTDGSIDLSVSGGTTDHSISWTGPDGFGSQQEDLSGLAAGTYALQVTDANGCVFEQVVTLTQGLPIAAELSSTPVSCPGDNNGALDLSLISGEAPFTFAWSGPNGPIANTEDLNGVASGVYQVNITDALGCSVLLSAEVQEPTPIQSGSYLSFYGQFNLQCAGDSTGVIELAPQGGNGPYAVNVAGPGGYSSTATEHAGLVAGTYNVNITDASGCAFDTTIVLTQPDQVIDATLEVSVYPSGTNVSCYGAADGSIDATVNGGVGPYEFFWRGPDSLEFSSEDISGLTAGQYAYELVVTDANQCSFFTNIILDQPDTLLYGSTVLSSYNGGYQVSCPGASDGAIDLTVLGGNGGYQYDWSGPTGSLGNGQDQQGLTSGSYTVTVTDINGCILTEVITLNAPEPLGIALEPLVYPGGSTVSCNGANDGQLSTSIIGGVGGYLYSWTGPNGFSSDAAIITDLAPGEYCLSILDANACSSTACATITQPDVLTSSTDVTNALCGDANGTIDLSVLGGSAPFTHAWDNGATTEDLSGLSGGTYLVSITDANGCTLNASATVASTPGVLAEATITDNVCHGASEGAIDLQVTSGSAPFSFVWSNGSTAEDIVAGPAGSYSVTVTDTNGCTYIGEYTVTENPALVIDTLVTRYSTGFEVSTWQGNDGSISTSVSGGTAPYSYAWSNGASSSSISDLSAGTYTLVVTDALGCTTTIAITLDQPSDLVMPTGFSPNGDGANDAFWIQGLDAYPANTLSVVNRWGNVVYDRLNYRNDWNGENTEGQMLPSGTYFVILAVNNGERTLQGFVDLRR